MSLLSTDKISELLCQTREEGIKKDFRIWSYWSMYTIQGPTHYISRLRLKIHQHRKELWDTLDIYWNSNEQLPWVITEGKRSCCMTRLTTNNREDRTLNNRKQVVVLKCQHHAYTIIMCHGIKWHPSKTDPQRWLIPDGATGTSQQEYYSAFAIRRSQGPMTRRWRTIVPVKEPHPLPRFQVWASF